MKKIKFLFSAVILLVLSAMTVSAQNSVLSTGDWFKFSTTENGIYKIGYTDLQSYGINPDVVNPKYIRLFGNGNGMLPEDPDAFRYDDLKENAIFIYGEDDGVFDPGDYILFYGEGPTQWTLNEETGFFEHETNLYSDKVCYFLTIGEEEGKRIDTQFSTIVPPTLVTSSSNDFIAHEIESSNLLGSGKHWFGEKFDEITTYEFEYDFPNILVSEAVNLTVSAVARSAENSGLNCKVNGNDVLDLSFLTIVPGLTQFARSKTESSQFYVDGSGLNLSLTYIKPNDSAIAWLDYFCLNYKNKLVFENEELMFRNSQSTGPGKVTQFEIQASNGDFHIWNITNPLEPRQVDFQFEDETAFFTLETDSLLEFIAFGDGEYPAPEFIEELPNQNLHGMDPVDLLILSPEEFTGKAHQLAELRLENDGLTSAIISPAVIYNEFSSGVQDVSAIRDFVKYLYNKDTLNGLKYLLLFGKGSYDYKDRLENNTNFVPVWETEESLNMVNAYCSDDFFVSDFQFFSSYQYLPVGRIPVASVTDANYFLDKLMAYEDLSISGGHWKNEITSIADDEDGNLHFQEAEYLAEMIDTSNNAMNLYKIYFDAFPQVVDPEGNESYPGAKEKFNSLMDEGNLIVNYIGHGGYSGLAGEKFLTVEDISGWDNQNKYPLLISACCGDLSGIDNPENNALGEVMLFSPDKGMIAVCVATSPTYASPSFTMNAFLLRNLLKFKQERLGEIFRNMKNASNDFTNKIKFVLLGDPSMRLAIPELNVQTEFINGVPVEDFTDTISPGSQVVVAGKITDDIGVPVNNFNGQIDIRVFDRPVIDSTLGNDPSSEVAEFTVRETVIAEVTTDVENGVFEAGFTLPQSLDEAFGTLKISYYALSDENDAQGQYSEIIAGGQYNAVGEQALDEKIRVYPTLTSDHIYLEFNTEISETRIGLFDPTGLPVFSETTGHINSGQKMQINVAALKTGLYILKISGAEAEVQYKIVKH